jgi:hypothetical protein
MAICFTGQFHLFEEPDRAVERGSFCLFMYEVAIVSR